MDRVVPLMMGLTAVALGMMQAAPGMRERLWKMDRLVLDGYHADGRKAAPASEVVVLGIDAASQTLDTLWEEDVEGSAALRAMKTGWPWPRRVWAELLDRLFAAGAKMVFLDLMFNAPSPDPEDDQLLREAVARHRDKVVLGAKFEEVFVGNMAQFALTQPPSTMLPEGFEGIGLLTFWPDADGMVRVVDYEMTRYEAEQRFSPGEAVADAEERPIPAVSRLMVTRLGNGAGRFVRDRERIRFGAPEAYPPVSLHQVFVGDLWRNNFREGEVFRDRVVLVGATAKEMQDFHLTPVGELAGVQIHAHALAALLDNEFVREAPEWWRWCSLAGGGVLAWALVRWVRRPMLGLLGMWVCSGLALLGGLVLFDGWNVEVSPLPLLLGLNLCGIVGLTGNYAVQRHETQRLRRSLVRYTSPAFVEELLRDREGLLQTLGGVERTVTVFFSDVRGFTTMAETMRAAEIVGQLNEYLSRMVERVFFHRGLVDKFIGDAVMALWGSLRSDQDEAQLTEDARHSVMAALAMRRVLRELNEGWRARGMPELEIGMGIHQGLVVAGNIGSESPYEKMDITVIGDSVNLASRLEGATKEYGLDLVISDAVRQRVAATMHCRSVDLVRVKGKLQPVEIFTVLDTALDEEVPGLEPFEEGIALYRAGNFAEAKTAFAQAAAYGLDDVLTKIYQQRCETLLASAPSSWDGVFVMTKK